MPAAPDADSVSATREGMDRVGVEIVPRRQWPSGMAALGADLRGRIPADLQAQPGRAIARLDGLGWSGALRELFESRDAEGRPVDGETPEPLRGAAVRALTDWRELWGAGEDGPVPLVDGVVAVRSVTRPQLLGHLGPGLARYLGVPFFGTVGPVAGMDEPTRHEVNSAQRLAAVSRRLGLELDDAGVEALQRRAVLLVDDFTDSGWTLTVAARMLLQAGAQEVYPFVLGVR